MTAQGTNLLYLAALLLALSAACAKNPPELEAQRKAQVHRTLARHLHHEEQMLSLLERNRQAPELAATELTRYADLHAEDLEALCSQRRLLETEPTALANALTALADRSRAVQSRRQGLYDKNPELMAHPGVKRALSRLDML